MTAPTLPDADASGMTRRDLLRRGGLVGGALLWVAPAVQVIDLTAASADHASGHTGSLPSHIEIIVRVVTARTFTYRNTQYTTVVDKVVGLKYDESDGGWVNLNRNSNANSSCVPTGTSSDDDAAVLNDFKANVPVMKATSGVAAYIVTLPDRYAFVGGWRKKGNDAATRCQAATKVGDSYAFYGF